MKKREWFRLAIEIADNVNIWFKDTFNIDPKRKVLEKKQDLVTMKESEIHISIHNFTFNPATKGNTYSDLSLSNTHFV